MISKRDAAFLSIAEKIAHKSAMRQKLAAIVVHRSAILAVGYNRHLRLGSNIHPPAWEQWSFHAERDAYRKAMKVYPELRGEKLTIYVARKNYGLAKPCQACFSFLRRKVAHLVYSSGQST